MIRSMTGYGRAQQTVDSMNITVEIKSVNHRYFDFSAKLSRQYGFLEEKLKSFVNSFVSRGKVDCCVIIESLDIDDCQVQINHSLAKGYTDALKELCSCYDLKDDISVSTVARYTDIFSVRKAQADEEKIWQSVKSVAQAAVESLTAMRECEGEKLRQDILERNKKILSDVEFIEQRSPQTVELYTQKLNERMQTVLQDANIDQQRILLEAAIYADKIAVAEETIRLKSHISQLVSFLESNSPIGKKLDFLIQEFNREANTIGSKAQDIEITRKVIDLKGEIEKIREQVQNIE